MTNTLLISEKYVKTQSNIQDNVWGDFLTPAIREAQDIELQPIIGRPLYKKILKEVEEKYVEERFKTLIEDWIQPFLLYQTIVSLIPIIGTKLGNIGTVISNDEHVQNISSSERENLEYRYRYLADHYKSELQKYLLANKDLYPELTSTCMKNLNLKSSNSLPLWTGGVRHGQKESTDCPDKADYADPDNRKAGYIEGGKTVSVTKNNATTTVLPSEGYDGFSSVEVKTEVPIEDSKSVKITENNSITTVSASEGYDGVKEMNINVNIPIQDKKTVEEDINIQAGGSQTVIKTIDVDDGYDGMKRVDVTLNVSAPLDKIPLINGQKLTYFMYNNENFLDMKLKSKSEFLPTKYFDFSNVKDFYYMFNSSQPKGYVPSTNSYIYYWYDDWSSMEFNVNKIESSFAKLFSTYENFIFPKINFLENSSLTSLLNFNDNSIYDSYNIKNLSFLNNTQNIIDYHSAFSKWKITNENKNMFDNWKVFSQDEINKKQIKYKIDGIFSTLQNDSDTLITFDVSPLKNIFNNAYKGYIYPPPFYMPYKSSKVILSLKGIIGFKECLDYSGYEGIIVDDKFFSDTEVNLYKIVSSYWINTENIQDFINILPQNTKSRTIQLSSNTMNALTSDMKATAASKNWTLTT